MVRAALLLTLICGVVLVSWLRSAQARVGEMLVGFGSELAAWPDAHLDSKPRQLTVNGLELRLVTVSTPLDIHQALDRFGALCRKRGGLAAPNRLLKALGMSSLDGTFRQESDQKGVIACLDTGHKLALSELMPRLKTFQKSGDLSKLGALRYVLARRSGKTTTLLVLWTQGPAKLLDMFPKHGDAPGHDPVGVPRPKGSRRLLFAAEHDAPYSVTLYTLKGRSTVGWRAWYRKVLTARGWSLTKTAKRGGFLARSGTRTLLIRVGAAPSGSASDARSTLTVAVLAP